MIRMMIKMTIEDLKNEIKIKYVKDLENEEQDIYLLLDKINMFYDLNEILENNYIFDDKEMVLILSASSFSEHFYQAPNWKSKIQSLEDNLFIEAIKNLPEKIQTEFLNEPEILARLLELKNSKFLNLFKNQNHQDTIPDKLIQIPEIYEKIVSNKNKYFAEEISAISNIQILDKLLMDQTFKDRLNRLKEEEWKILFDQASPDFLKKISSYSIYMNEFAYFQIETLFPFLSKIYGNAQVQLLNKPEVNSKIQNLSADEIYKLMSSLDEYTTSIWINQNKNKIINNSEEYIASLVSAIKSKTGQQLLLEMDEIYQKLLDSENDILLRFLNNNLSIDMQQKLLNDPLFLESLQNYSEERFSKIISKLSPDIQLKLYQDKKWIKSLSKEQFDQFALHVNSLTVREIMKKETNLSYAVQLDLGYKLNDQKTVLKVLEQILKDKNQISNIDFFQYKEIIDQLTETEKRFIVRNATMKQLAHWIKKSDDETLKEEIIKRITSNPVFAISFPSWDVLLEKVDKKTQNLLMYYIDDYNQMINIYLKTKSDILEKKIVQLITHDTEKERSELVNFYFPVLYQNFDDATRLKILPHLKLKELARINSEVKDTRIYENPEEVVEIACDDFIRWYQNADKKMKGLLISYSSLKQLIEILKLEPDNNLLIDHITNYKITTIDKENLIDSESFYIFITKLKDQKIEKVINEIPLNIWTHALKKANDNRLFPYFLKKWIYHQDPLTEEEIDDICAVYQKLNREEQHQLVSTMNNHNLSTLMKYLKRPLIKEEWLKRYQQNKQILQSEDPFTINQIMANLEEQERMLQKEELLKELNQVIPKEYAYLRKQLETKSIGEIVKLSIAIQKGLLECENPKEKWNIIEGLLIRNPHLLHTLNFQILEDNLELTNISFIDKISRDIDLQKQLISLTESNQNQILSKLIKQIIDTKEEITQLRELNIITNALNQKHYQTIFQDTQQKEKKLKTIKDFILTNSNIFGISNLKEKMIPKSIEDILEYENNINEKCENIIKHSTNAGELKNAYFQKHFHLNIEEIKYLIVAYSSDITEFDQKNEAVEFLKKAINILALTNIDQIKEEYQKEKKKYSIEKIIEYEEYFKHQYSKNLTHEIKANTKKQPISEIIYQGKRIPVYDATEENYLLLHSLNSYGNLNLINNNYQDAWNLNTRTNNNGICCYVNNQEMQACPPINGPVVGFHELDEDAMILMAPYDLSTKNDKIISETAFQPLFKNMNDLVDNIRTNHSEVLIKRIAGTKNSKKHFYTQPDYILIYSDMKPNQKAECYKAASELNIPIYYFDREKITEKQTEQINQKIEQLKENHDINLLEEIIVQYENNKAGLERIKTIDWNSYISTSKIETTIKEEINEIRRQYQQKEINKETMEEKLKKIVDIVEKEQEKYQMQPYVTANQIESDIDIDEVYYHTKFMIDDEKAFTSTQISEILKEKLKKKKIITPYMKYKYIYEIDDDMKDVNRNRLYEIEGKHHNLDHIERVTLFTHIMADEDNLNEYEKTILIEAAKYHDCGRENDRQDIDHGRRGAEKVLESDIEASEVSKRIIASLIEYHEIPDSLSNLNKICQHYELDNIEKQIVSKLAPYLKDADALDRTRFKEHSLASLNENMLRTDISKKLVDLSKELQMYYQSDLEKQQINGKTKK